MRRLRQVSYIRPEAVSAISERDVVIHVAVAGAAGARLSGTVAAPKCAPGSTITVTIDVANAVDESNEDDDVVQRPCPLA